MKDVDPFSDEGTICDEDYGSSSSREDSSADFAIQDAYSSCSDSDVSHSINPTPPHCKTATTLSMETTKSVPPLRNYVKPEAASNSEKVSVDEELIPDIGIGCTNEPTTSSTQKLGRREVTKTKSYCFEEGDGTETELNSSFFFHPQKLLFCLQETSVKNSSSPKKSRKRKAGYCSSIFAPETFKREKEIT